jgi:hypothetical protein
MTRSRAATIAKAGQHAKSDVVVLCKSSGSAKVWPMAGNIGFKAGMRVQIPLLLPYYSIWILTLFYVVLFWFYSFFVCGFNIISREHVSFVT